MSNTTWRPQRTLAEGEHQYSRMHESQLSIALAHAILCAPGAPSQLIAAWSLMPKYTGALHELETRLIDGRVQRVYKNLWPSARFFWLWASDLYSVHLSPLRHYTLLTIDAGQDVHRV